MMNIKKQSSPKNKIFLALAVAAVLIIAGVSYWYFTANKPEAPNVPPMSEASQNSESSQNKEGTSEDTTFPVPSDTPAEAIKDYTLLVDNEQYKIRHQEGTNEYIITLYAIINNPDQYDYYQDQLKQYKQQALDYLKSKGLNPADLDITYEPQEAKDL